MPVGMVCVCEGVSDEEAGRRKPSLLLSVVVLGRTMPSVV